MNFEENTNSLQRIHTLIPFMLYTPYDDHDLSLQIDGVKSILLHNQKSHEQFTI